MSVAPETRGDAPSAQAAAPTLVVKTPDAIPLVPRALFAALIGLVVGGLAFGTILGSAIHFGARLPAVAWRETDWAGELDQLALEKSFQLTLVLGFGLAVTRALVFLARPGSRVQALVAGGMAAISALAAVHVVFVGRVPDPIFFGSELALLGAALAFGVLTFGRVMAVATWKIVVALAACAAAAVVWGLAPDRSELARTEASDLVSSCRVGAWLALSLAILVLPAVARIAERVEAWSLRSPLFQLPPATATVAATDEGWADHLAPVRGLGRVLFGALVRTGVGALGFGVVCVGTPVILSLLVREHWGWGYGIDVADTARTEGFAVTALLALSLGALGVLELFARVVKPEQSYARKLAMGGVVSGLSVVVVYALLFQLHYILGLVEGGGTLRAGLGEIANQENMLGSRHDGELWGIALAFGLVGFGRARGLPLWEQTALVAPFLLLWLSEKLVYEGTFVANGSSSHSYEVALWLSAWVAGLLVPVLARVGDVLDERWRPKSIRAR